MVPSPCYMVHSSFMGICHHLFPRFTGGGYFGSFQFRAITNSAAASTLISVLWVNMWACFCVYLAGEMLS